MLEHGGCAMMVSLKTLVLGGSRVAPQAPRDALADMWQRKARRWGMLAQYEESRLASREPGLRA